MTRNRTQHKTTGIKTHTTKKKATPTNKLNTPSGGYIRRGILTSFDPTTYTCSVLLLEATNTSLQNVPIAYHMDGTSALVNNFCAVLFFDEQNYTDALIIAIYPGAGVGSPTYLPGRVTFIPEFHVLSSVTITNGTTNTYTVTGVNHVPTNALGVLVFAYFTSATTQTYIQLAAHGSSSTMTIGNLSTANGFVNGNGMIPVDSNGKIDVSASAGDCVTTVYIYGYVI